MSRERRNCMALPKAYVRLAVLDGVPVLVMSKPYKREGMSGKVKAKYWGSPRKEFGSKFETDDRALLQLLNPRDPGLAVWAIDRISRGKPFLPCKIARLWELEACPPAALVSVFSGAGLVRPDDGWEKMLAESSARKCIKSSKFFGESVMAHAAMLQSDFGGQESLSRDESMCEAFLWHFTQGWHFVIPDGLTSYKGIIAETRIDELARKCASAAISSFPFSKNYDDYPSLRNAKDQVDTEDRVEYVAIADCLQALDHARLWATRLALCGDDAEDSDRTPATPLLPADGRIWLNGARMGNYDAFLEQHRGMGRRLMKLKEVPLLYSSESDQAKNPEWVQEWLSQRDRLLSQRSRPLYKDAVCNVEWKEPRIAPDGGLANQGHEYDYGIEELYVRVDRAHRKGLLKKCPKCGNLFIAQNGKAIWCEPNGACKRKAAREAEEAKGGIGVSSADAAANN